MTSFRILREIRKLVTKLDRPVKQVLIETRIVEAKDSFSRGIGVKLGFTRVQLNTGLGSVIGTGTSDGAEALRADATGRVTAVDLSSQLSNAASYAINVAKAGSDYANLIDLEITGLIRQVGYFISVLSPNWAEILSIVIS